jgi:F-type H+-transporting ATPase subunit b
MPQIAQILETYASQFFWMLITFGLIYFGIAKMMLPKVEATVDARDQKIADDLAAAQKARNEAESNQSGSQEVMIAARADAQATAAAAKAKAAKDAEARLAKANAEIGERLALAEADVAKASAAAMTKVDAVAAEAAADMVAKLAGVSVSAKDAQAAVKMVMSNG